MCYMAFNKNGSVGERDRRKFNFSILSNVPGPIETGGGLISLKFRVLVLLGDHSLQVYLVVLKSCCIHAAPRVFSEQI